MPPMRQGGKLSETQLRHLRELREVEKSSNSGEAFWSPWGSHEHRSAAVLSRRGLIRREPYGRTFSLTDAGREEIDRA